jgi:FimV-like protein
MRPVLLPCGLAFCLAISWGPPVQAQTPTPDLDVRELTAQGDSLRRLLRPLDALERYEAALSMDEGDYEALWKAAREAVTLGMLAADDDAAQDRYRKATELARRATEAAPERSQGHEWLAISLGRLALREGPRTRVRLSRQVQEEALYALAIDSLSAAAHHVLGQWHAEIRRLSGIERFFARKVMGADEMDQASWSSAERHLARAAELAPDRPIHQLELARVYVDTDRPDLARELLRTVLDLPTTEATDPLMKEEAQELLVELNGG